MNTTATHHRPDVRIGTIVRKEHGPQGWGVGVVIATEPERVIVSSSWSREHGSSGIVWGDSDTHTRVTIHWTDGAACFGTEPSTRTIMSVGHSFAGTVLDTTTGGWPAGFTTEAPAHWNEG